MKNRSFHFLISALLWISLLWNAGPGMAQTAPELRAEEDAPDVLRMSVAEQNPEIVPYRVIDASGFLFARNLFLGLVREKDDDHSIQYELAQSCQGNAAATVFECTLRSGVTWSDGSALDGNDVRSSILYVLGLDEAEVPYQFFLRDHILNAEEYHNGEATAQQVGLEVLEGGGKVRFTLKTAFAPFLHILTLPIAYPLPLDVMQTHGEDWWKPETIVTSGAYRLTGWENGSHAVLEKWDGFFNAEHVSIEKVVVAFQEADEALEAYMRGDLDTLEVPFSRAKEVEEDPLLFDQAKFVPSPCTYYYGFNVSRAPFDRLNVRKALVAAVDRQGLVNDLNLLGEKALTFISPGVFGHTASGVGVDYNLTQAQTWMSLEYPDYADIPAIDLWYNTSTGHQQIAQAVESAWESAFPGLVVNLHSTVQSDYIPRLNNGEFPAWRMGWCADYTDGINFLRDAVSYPRFGAWDYSAYDADLDLALQAYDEGVRAGLYQAAEKILVEDDAVMMPIYFYRTALLNKPSLTRTYGDMVPYLMDWSMQRSMGTEVDVSGAGDFTTPVEQIQYLFEAGSFGGNVNITHTLLPPADAPNPGTLGLRRSLYVFESRALAVSDGQPLEPLKDFTLRIPYSQLHVDWLGIPDEESLALFYFDEGRGVWVKEPSSSVDAGSNLITASVNRMGTWAVMDGRVYQRLPLVKR